MSTARAKSPMSIRALTTGLSCVCVCALTACAHPQPPLYSWKEFPGIQYETLLKAGSPMPGQIAAMERLSAQAQAAHTALPPGFRAHFGLLKIAAGDPTGAGDMWRGEKAAFPESKPYMDQLLKRLDGSANAGGGL